MPVCFAYSYACYVVTKAVVFHLKIIIIMMMIITIIIIIIIITYLTRVNPSAEAVINGCPGLLKN